MTSDAVNLIFESFVDKKFGIFVNRVKDEIFVLWKSIAEWEEFIFASAVKHQKIESIETLEYITNDEDNITEEFYGMEKDLLVIILQNLERQKKCVVIY